MIPLDDKRWQQFEGGYRIPYDASILLRGLKVASVEERSAIFSELWDELYHQGDVGLASYFAVPHLIDIAIEQQILDYNVFGIVATIEIARHRNNPGIPNEFESKYMESIKENLPKLIQMTLVKEWDTNTTPTILSALAVSKGHIDLADAISKMDDADIINELLERY